MTDRLCRWGFLGTAAIARKNWKAIQLSGNGRVAAVASRSIDRANTFIEECSAESQQCEPVNAMGCYEDLIHSDEIDVVYVPLPTGLRKEWVIAAAEAGKHVLCEKPVAIHAQDAAEMMDACRASNVQFMDGVMFDHGTRITEICQQLRDPNTIGKLRRIQTHFSFPSDDAFEASNIRANCELEPHGCVGDLGWYCIRFTLWLTDLQMPHHVSAQTLTAIGGKNAEHQVPGAFSAEMFFADELSAAFYCSFLSGNQQTAIVSGSNGYLSVNDFVLPFYDGQVHWGRHAHDLQVANCRWNYRQRSELHSIDEYSSGESNAQEVNMVRRMSQIAIDGEVDARYSELALKTQQIVDACRRSAIGGGEQVAL
ncbi:Gfo/Idh/MocA family protein [Novipirellula artificiosorum]|uniref:Glucose--fructose oxidoreductase n=1 Tax=Novipirellula artificiosorum TaxID=2528016 RepID=A0A5C6DGW6_9BACT|nr:Gfo/Idh/MocA family oxidoreductase [Novipirellula artificiosorum]TWU34981.1 Glucose--fructose oxidoreductase precursor [Novipirellula artificiosorum]